LPADPIGERGRSLPSALPAIPIGDGRCLEAELAALRRIHVKDVDALAVEHQGIAVEHEGAAGEDLSARRPRHARDEGGTCKQSENRFQRVDSFPRATCRSVALRGERRNQMLISPAVSGI
jgi:hypothetical protein